MPIRPTIQRIDLKVEIDLQKARCADQRSGASDTDNYLNGWPKSQGFCRKAWHPIDPGERSNEVAAELKAVR
ncbi:hypothetical protein MesoLjLc_32760 [Mesorhizobium sp. L-8-10]|nr:hypothetical protein MesoLjLc_32760 [Mesorhizobium sp. L-8-10]